MHRARDAGAHPVVVLRHEPAPDFVSFSFSPLSCLLLATFSSLPPPPPSRRPLPSGRRQDIGGIRPAAAETNKRALFFIALEHQPLRPTPSELRRACLFASTRPSSHPHRGPSRRRHPLSLSLSHTHTLSILLSLSTSLSLFLDLERRQRYRARCSSLSTRTIRTSRLSLSLTTSSSRARSRPNVSFGLEEEEKKVGRAVGVNCLTLMEEQQAVDGFRTAGWAA